MRWGLLLLLSVSCGAPTHDMPVISDIDWRLRPAVERFAELTAGKGLQFQKVASVQISSDLQPGRLGACRFFGTRFDVLIAEETLSYSEEVLRLTVYHELVHCSLGDRNHREAGLMASSIDWTAAADPDQALLDYVEGVRRQ